MVRPMKWHIYNGNHEPLCWDVTAIEFDTREAAERFLKSCFEEGDRPDEFYDNAIIVEDILYYDGGYLDATNMVVAYDEESGESYLKLYKHNTKALSQ